MRIIRQLGNTRAPSVGRDDTGQFMLALPER